MRVRYPLPGYYSGGMQGVLTPCAHYASYRQEVHNNAQFRTIHAAVHGHCIQLIRCGRRQIQMQNHQGW